MADDDNNNNAPTTSDDPIKLEEDQSDNKIRKGGLTAKGDQRQFVKHCYHDRAEEPTEILTTSDENTLRLYREDSVGGPFPVKLHIVLKVVEKMGKQSIVSWLPHGRSFMIHRPREFEDQIMGKFFKQTKLTSFRRQLNLYDFQRITHGRDAGSYYHELFLRGKPLLAKKMVRRKVKGTKIRASSSPDDEPNFYSMPFVGPAIDSSQYSSAGMPDIRMMNPEAMYGPAGGGGQGSSTEGASGDPRQFMNHPMSYPFHPGSMYPGFMNGFNRMPNGYPEGGMQGMDYFSMLQRNNLASFAMGYGPYGNQFPGMDPRMAAQFNPNTYGQENTNEQGTEGQAKSPKSATKIKGEGKEKNNEEKEDAVQQLLSLQKEGSKTPEPAGEKDEDKSPVKVEDKKSPENKRGKGKK